MLQRHGGAYLLGALPGGLAIKQRGRDPSHHEIVPARTMTFEQYAAALGTIALTRV